MALAEWQVGSVYTLVAVEDQGCRGLVVGIRARRIETGEAAIFDKASLGLAIDTLRHLQDSVTPVRQAIVKRVWHDRQRATPKQLQVTIVPPAVFSAKGLKCEVVGGSLGTAVLLVELSAELDLPLRQDIAVAGSVSLTGEISPVKNLALKVTAAANDPRIRKLILPPLDPDGSVGALAPLEKEQILDAIETARRRLDIVHVANVHELLEKAFEPAAIVPASLRGGFFLPTTPCDEDGSIIQKAAAFLTEGNEQRFWSSLRTASSGRDYGLARSLIRHRVQFDIGRGRYSGGLGAQLETEVARLPAEARSLKGFFPLLTHAERLRLCELAGETFQDDFDCLWAAVSGRAAGVQCRRDSRVRRSKDAVENDAKIAAAVDRVLDNISGESLAARVDKPINSTAFDHSHLSAVCQSDSSFLAGITDQFVSLSRSVGTIIPVPVAPAISEDAVALVERTFQGAGGYRGALATAKNGGSRGGLRHVLTAMTDRFIAECRLKYSSRVFKEALEPLNGRGRIAFVKAFLAKAGPSLPPDIRTQSPGCLARHYEVLVEAYVRSMDRVKELLRTL